MRKRILSLLLCIVLCLSLMPTVAFAAEPTPITEVIVTYTTPMMGDPINNSDITVTTVPADAADVLKTSWRLPLGPAGAEFEQNSYYISAQIKPKSGYAFEYDSEGDYTGSVTYNGNNCPDKRYSYVRNDCLTIRSDYMTPVPATRHNITFEIEGNACVSVNGTLYYNGQTLRVNDGEHITVGTKIVAGTKLVDASSNDVTLHHLSSSDPSAGRWFTMPAQDVTVKFTFSDAPAATTHTVSFDMKGHGEQIQAKTVNEGDQLSKPADPVAEGWKFEGWYTDEALTEEYVFGALVFENITLHAKWTEIEHYTVTYDANGGTGSMPSEQIYVNSEGIAVYSFPTCGFTAPAGQKFDHWEVEGNNNTFSEADQLAIFGDVIVKPIWVADDGPSNEPHTVSFIMNGHGDQVADQRVNEGAKATKPADPSASGYTFEGWYADATFSAAFDFDTAIAADTTLYAKWTQDSSTPSEAKLTLSVTSVPAAGTPVTIDQHVSHYYTVKNTGSEPVRLDGIYKEGVRLLQYVDTTLAPGESSSWGQSGFDVAEANITQNAQGEKGVADSFYAAGSANGVAVNSNTVTDWHPLKTSDNPTPTPDKPNTPTNPPKDNLDNSPKTGDARQTVLWIGMLMVSFGTAAAAVQISRKKDQV